MTAGAAPSDSAERARPGPTGPAAAPQTTNSAKVSEQGWKRCTRGAACFYKKSYGQGKIRKAFAGTDKDARGINSAWNNGRTSERRDHALVKWHYAGSGKDHWGCLSPGERWKNTASFVMDAVRWRPACKL